MLVAVKRFRRVSLVSVDYRFQRFRFRFAIELFCLLRRHAIRPLERFEASGFVIPAFSWHIPHLPFPCSAILFHALNCKMKFCPSPRSGCNSTRICCIIYNMHISQGREQGRGGEKRKWRRKGRALHASRKTVRCSICHPKRRRSRRCRNTTDTPSDTDRMAARDTTAAQRSARRVGFLKTVNDMASSPF